MSWKAVAINDFLVALRLILGIFLAWKLVMISSFNLNMELSTAALALALRRKCLAVAVATTSCCPCSAHYMEARSRRSASR